MTERERRQKAAYDWTVKAFGPDHANSKPQRATRFIEEAIELYQTCGGDQAMLHRLVDAVFDKPPGDILKELGDVGLTLLTVAEISGFDADFAEASVVADALVQDPEIMFARNAAKNAAGFDAGAYPVGYVREQPFNERRIVGGTSPYMMHGSDRRERISAYGPGSITDGETYERCKCDKRFKRHCIQAMGDCDAMDR